MEKILFSEQELLILKELLKEKIEYPEDSNTLYEEYEFELMEDMKKRIDEQGRRNLRPTTSKKCVCGPQPQQKE
jgi:hypothetical protein